MNYIKTLTLTIAVLLGGGPFASAQDSIPVPEDAKQAPSLLLNQWAWLASDGVVVGKISTGDGQPTGVCQVALVGMDGPAHRYTSTEDGIVQMRSVTPGVYALTVRGRNLVAAYALEVVETDDPSASAAPLPIYAARLNTAKFYSQVVRMLPAEAGPTDEFDAEAARQLALQIDVRPGARVQQVDGGVEGCLFAAGMRDGALIPAGPTNVFILRDGLELDRVETDAAGCFRFDEISTGGYSLIAVGPSGVAVTSFQVVDSGATAKLDAGASPFRLASAVQGPGMSASPRLNLQLAPSQGALDGFESFGAPEGGNFGPPPFPMGPGGLAPPPGGFAGGGGFGGGLGGGGAGGGGSGGLGGIGGLAGFAGLALGVAALADDDDGFDVPGPASPAIPAP
jgi:hypothetical protein